MLDRWCDPMHVGIAVIRAGMTAATWKMVDWERWTDQGTELIFISRVHEPKKTTKVVKKWIYRIEILCIFFLIYNHGFIPSINA